MKNQIIFAVLAVVAVYVSAAVVKPDVEAEPVVIVESSAVEVEPAIAENRNLNIGNVTVGDRLLHRDYYIKYPIYNAIQYQDITYRGINTTRITAVQANEVGYTQFATTTILAGGINNSTVTVRISSARGYGYYVLLDIYGR